ERAGIKGNLGWSYAMSAIEMASLMHQVNGAMPNATGRDRLPAAATPALRTAAAHEAEQRD
ncbi:MAG: 6,7-dimethyl-8-ribityllumazine synthase, partial [Geitlerinemataceae cyanobacterium]